MSQKIVTNLFRYVAGSGADSLTVHTQPGRVTFDCSLADGRVWTLAVPPKLEEEFLSVLRRLLRLTPGEFISGQNSKLHGKEYRLNFRLTVRPHGEGEKIIMSLVREPIKLWRLNQLGLPAAAVRDIKKTLSSASGLIVVSSPSRQGRSASLAALLMEINDAARSVYWLSGESSAFEVPGVNYLDCRRANWDKILAHDSDIIFADDADEDWQIALACRAAATGRLVLIALESDDLALARERILRVASQESLPSGCLKIVLNQRLANWPQARAGARKTAASRTRIGRFEIWQK